jgi:hypothetical protein
MDCHGLRDCADYKTQLIEKAMENEFPSLRVQRSNPPDNQAFPTGLGIA